MQVRGGELAEWEVSDYEMQTDSNTQVCHALEIYF